MNASTTLHWPLLSIEPAPNEHYFGVLLIILIAFVVVGVFIRCRSALIGVMFAALHP